MKIFFLLQGVQEKLAKWKGKCEDLSLNSAVSIIWNSPGKNPPENRLKF